MFHNTLKKIIICFSPFSERENILPNNRCCTLSGAIVLIAMSVSCSPRSESQSGLKVVPHIETVPPSSSSISLKHDFGVLPPGEKVTHAFALRNTSDAAWTFDSIRTSCGCAVADISEGIVPPGGQTTVTVRYQVPSTVGDDQRVVGVEFKEPTAPVVRLTVASKVRLPVCLLPTAIRVEARHDRPTTTHLYLCSYRSDLTQAPQLLASADWVTLGPAKAVPTPSDDASMSRRWQVPVSLATDRLGPGEHRATVCLAAGAGAGEVLIPIDVRVAPPLTPTPSQLFFGVVRPGRLTTVNFSIRLPAGLSPDEVRVEHDLGSQLVVTKTAHGGGRVSWEAALTADDKPGALSGVVRVSAPDLPPTRLPVLAEVKP